MKIVGLKLPENCTLTFHANGIDVRVSLNVEKDLLPWLPAERIHKGTMFVYWIRDTIPLEYCSPKNICSMYNILLKRAMIRVREAKERRLRTEIRYFEELHNQLKLEFDESIDQR